MPAHIGGIFANGSQSHNKAAVGGTFGCMEPLVIIDFLIHIGNHAVIVAVGHITTASCKAQGQPLTAGGTGRGITQCCHVIAGSFKGFPDGILLCRHSTDREC